MHASTDTTFWKRQTIGVENISGSQAEGVTTKGQNEGVCGEEGPVLCLILVVISQLYAFAKAHRTKIILFYVNKKISKKKINRGGLTEGIILCRGVTKTA